MIEVARLAALLAPALPYLLKAGGRVVDEAASALGGAGFKQANEVWKLLRAKVEASPSASQTATQLASQPADEGLREAFAQELQRLLAASPGLEESLANITGPVTIVKAQGEGSVAIGGGAQGAIIVTGDQNEIER